MPEKMYFASGPTLDAATASLYRTAKREKACELVGAVEIALRLKEKRKILAEGAYSRCYDKAFQVTVEDGVGIQYFLEHKDRISVTVKVRAAFKPQEKAKEAAKGKPSGCAMPERSTGSLTELL